MQADVESAVVINRLTLDASLGWQEIPSSQRVIDSFISRRHYALWKFTDELSIRGGRFFEAYGLNIPDHVAVTRRPLGFDEGMEDYHLEGSWLGEKLGFFGTANLGRPDNAKLNREPGFSATVSYFFADRYKVGWSYRLGSTSSVQRHLTGPWAILGFWPHLFLLTEWDFQSRQSRSSQGPSVQSLNVYQRLDYEIIQGLHAYFTQELARRDLADSAMTQAAYSLGTQFFPRPHFEILLQWQKTKEESANLGFTDAAWLMFHYYW